MKNKSNVNLLLFLTILLIPIVGFSQSTTSESTVLDDFKSYFIGTWQGSESGSPGNGAGYRTYESAVQDTYVLMKNQSVFAPDQEGGTREFHEDWGMYSLDQSSSKIIYRQFNSEGFVNTFETVVSQLDSVWVFETRHIENLPAGWTARITINKINEYKFTETFELARPKQDYQQMLSNTWIKTSR